MDHVQHEAAVASVKKAELDAAERGSRRPRSRTGPARARGTGRARRTPASGDDEWAAAELTRAVAAGDAHAALPLAIDRYGAVVYHYCRRMLGNGDEGDDVAQVVFIQAFEVIQRRQRVDNLRAYLLGIARYRCLDRLTVRRSAPILLDTHELERTLESEAPGDSPSSDPRMSEALDACLDELDRRSRTVLLLRFHDGLAYAEISRLTGDRPGALRVRVARALRILRRSLERRNIVFEAPDHRAG